MFITISDTALKAYGSLLSPSATSFCVGQWVIASMIHFAFSFHDSLYELCWWSETLRRLQKAISRIHMCDESAESSEACARMYPDNMSVSDISSLIA